MLSKAGAGAMRDRASGQMAVTWRPSDLGNREADAADEKIRGRFLRRKFDQLNGVIEGARTKDEAAGLEAHMAEEEMSAEANAVDIGAWRLPGGERIVMAVDDDEGAEAEDRIHGESLSRGNADGNEAIPGAAADGTTSGKCGKPAFRQLDEILHRSGGDQGSGHGGGVRDEGNAIHGTCVNPFRGRKGRRGDSSNFLDAEGLCQQDTIERGEAETASSMKEVGYMRLRQARLASEEGGAENTKVDATPDLQAQALMQLKEFHLLKVFNELYTHYLRVCSKNCNFASSAENVTNFSTQV
jgi:hypothetical protein